MTDAEIEQARKSLAPAIAPLYVDSKADERSAALFNSMVEIGLIPDLGIDPTSVEYEGDGSIVRPFRTLEEARAVQKPGQSIVITGYATIGAAVVPPKPFVPCEVPENIKERCS